MLFHIFFLFFFYDGISLFFTAILLWLQLQSQRGFGIGRGGNTCACARRDVSMSHRAFQPPFLREGLPRHGIFGRYHHYRLSPVIWMSRMQSWGFCSSRSHGLGSEKENKPWIPPQFSFSPHELPRTVPSRLPRGATTEDRSHFSWAMFVSAFLGCFTQPLTPPEETQRGDKPWTHFPRKASLQTRPPKTPREAMIPWKRLGPSCDLEPWALQIPINLQLPSKPLQGSVQTAELPGNPS